VDAGKMLVNSGNFDSSSHANRLMLRRDLISVFKLLLIAYYSVFV
jgi:hypothetical protein